MQHPAAGDAIDEAAGRIEEFVGMIDRANRRDPDDVFENVLGADVSLPVGELAPLGEPRVRTVADTTAYHDWPSWSRSYGIDASISPKTLAFTNGSFVNVAYAVAGESRGPAHVGQHGTLVTGTYLGENHQTDVVETVGEVVTEHEAATGDRHDVELRSLLTRPPMSTYTAPPNRRGGGAIPRWVKQATRTIAEGEHFARHRDAFDGPVFLDGPIYPLTLLSRYHYVQATSSATPSPEWWRYLTGRLQTYIDAIDAHLASGYPVLGITKTTNATSLIRTIQSHADALGERLRLRWTTDYQFVSDLLGRHARRAGAPRDTVYAYTSWFTHDRISIGQSRVDPLTPGPEDDPDLQLRGGDPEPYRRAFFYVQPPSGVVFRVETLAGLVEEATPGDRHELQQRLVHELVESDDVPLAIKRADADARIPRRLVDRLEARFTEHEGFVAIVDYNLDVRNPSADARTDYYGEREPTAADSPTEGRRDGDDR